MRLERDHDITAFLEKTSDWLAAGGTIHSFLLGQALKARDGSEQPALLVRGFGAGGALAAVGLQTELQRVLIISRMDETAGEAFAKSLAPLLLSLPGVKGPTPCADTFAAAWAAAKGCSTRLEKQLRLFELTELSEPRRPAGSFRAAESRDETALFRFLRAFHEEAVPHDPRSSDETLTAHIREATSRKQFYVWEDQGECVCLVGSRRETQTEKWIAPVYTPPALRGRGYASALVADVSRKILALGKKGALFTDLENPTSNSIYQKIGYRAVADFRHFLFS